MESSRPRANYYLLQTKSATEQLGGTGIFLTSRLNYLGSITDRIDLRVVPVQRGATIGFGAFGSIISLLLYMLREARMLISGRTDIHYLVYP